MARYVRSCEVPGVYESAVLQQYQPHPPRQGLLSVKCPGRMLHLLPPVGPLPGKGAWLAVTP
eukprot:11019724-Heterocapsa_arctica.AAC.1